jgi:hypothetical protein
VSVFFAHAEISFTYNGAAAFCRTLQRAGYFSIPVAFEVFNLEKAASHREHRVHREKSACYILFVAHPAGGTGKRGQAHDFSVFSVA